MKTKKIITFVLLTVIIINLFIQKVNAENVTVSVINNPKIDIMLTSKDTNLDLTNFEQDIINSLNQKGINTSNIRFQTTDRTIIDTNSSDASKIFNQWTTFPYNISSNWYYVANGGYITSNVNEPYETGFIDQTVGQVKDVTLSSKIYAKNDWQQPVGYIIRMSPQENSSRYNLYMLWTSGFDGYNYDQNKNGASAINASYYTTPKRTIVLFKVEGLILDYNIWKNYATNGTYSATPLHQTMYSGTKRLGWSQHEPRNYGGFPDGTLLQNGITATNSGDPNLKTTILGYSSVELSATNPDDTFDLKIDTKGDTFKIYYNNALQFTVKDSSYKKGYYGVFEYSHVSPRFYGITAEYTSYKTYKEVLTEPTWRDEAKHIVVNIDDEIDNTLTSPDTIGEILSRTLEENIHFIQWGTDINKTESNNFINKNDNKGLFTYNTDYNKAIDETTNYIKNLIDQEKTEQYVIVGQESHIIVTPEELKNNAISSDYPNGRWLIHHDYKYYENNQGQSTETEKYISNLICTFDKPGKYIIKFDDIQVKEVYAHRLPIADFDIKINKTELILTNTSYDLDNSINKGYGIGIKSEKWSYKEINSNNWISKKLTTIDPNKTYIIKLEIEDNQGGKAYTTKYIGTGNPIANFSYEENVISKYKELEIINKSYDPEGNEIVSYTWELKKGSTIIQTSPTPITNFNTSNLGIGKYTYTLIVTNNKGKKSEKYSKSFEVIEDKDAPEVIINPTNCDWKENQIVNLIFSDNGSGFSKWRYSISDNQTDTKIYSEYNTLSTGNVEINKTGIYYLHIEALDKAGNTLKRVVGPYKIDQDNPIIENTEIKEENSSAKIYITASDLGSGILGYQITTNQIPPTNYKSSNKLEVTKNGIYYIWVSDVYGHVVNKQIEIKKISHTINTSINKNGTISNSHSIIQNESTSIFIVPMKGYEIENVVVDGISVGKVKTYNFINVDRNHTVIATFKITSNWQEELNKINNKYSWINIDY